MGQRVLTVRMEGDWKLFKKFLMSARFRANLEREIKRATIRNSLILLKMVKLNIRGKNFAEKAPLTLAFSMSNVPLIDEQNLWNALNFKLHSSWKSEIGILGNQNSTGSKFGKNSQTIGMQNLVKLMEEGYTVTVTPAMRKAIAAALAEKSKQDVFKGSASTSKTTTYRVPSRPVLTDTWKDPSIDNELKRNWILALERAWKQQGAKDGQHKARQV